MIIKDAVLWGQGELSASSDTARLDAEVLLGFVLKKNKTQMISAWDEEIDPAPLVRFQELVQRRKAREPVPYITGRKEFYGLAFEVTPAVLIPRPETELLVEACLEFASARKGTLRILDLGTGSGCIVVAIAVEMKRRGGAAKIIAIDASAAALEVAARNAAHHDVADMIELRRGDWCGALLLDEKFEVIVSNPPYVAEGADLEFSLSYEPKSALFAGTDGMGEIRRLVPQALERLLPGGVLFMEIGWDQKGLVESLASRISPRGLSLTFIKDLQGHARVARLSLE